MAQTPGRGQIGAMIAHPAAPFPDRPPYRPFLSGPPRFAPALSPIPESLWLRPDPEHAANLANRAAVLSAHPEAAQWDADSLPAQEEALGLIEASLPPPAGGEVLRSETEGDDTPILRAGSLLADDLVVMEKRGANKGPGVWRATALLLTAPTFFDAETAFGRDLFALHEPVPGNAPDDFGIGHTTLGLSARIGALFDRLPDDAVMQRFNWTLQCGGARFARDGAVQRARAARLGPERAAAALHLRVERQTIRRLPRTGAVLFTIRVALDPVSALAPDLRALLGESWRGADARARAYKNWDALEPAARIAFAAV